MNVSMRFLISLLFLLISEFGLGIAEAYQEDGKLVGVTVQGQVTYQGTIPTVELIGVNRDQAFCGKSIADHSLRIDKPTKGIAQIVINLKEISAGKASPKPSQLTLNNQDCTFQPPVSMGFSGSSLEIASSDPVLHNTHILHNEETFLNVALPPGGRKIRKTLGESGRLNVRCDAHPFMRASIHIFEHPYFTVTDQTGAFVLTQVPPGTYTVQFWHQTLGIKEVSIKVTPSAPLDLKVNFP